MNRKEHFVRFHKLEEEIKQDHFLKDKIFIVSDQSMAETDISSTSIRELVNKKAYDKLEGMLT